MPGEALGKRLCETFPYLWKSIVKDNNAESAWRTITPYALRPRELWRLWQAAEVVCGVRFGKETRYALIDLDVRGQYHPDQNPNSLPEIRASLETIGITRTFLLRSSWSGGLHLWISLPEAVPTFGLASALKQCLEQHAFRIAQGALELFPNCKAYARPGEFTEYQGHRLPLQTASGSQLLNDDLQPSVGGLSRFFELWDLCAAGQDIDQLRLAVQQAQVTFNVKALGKPSTRAEAWRQALETEIAEGWTDYGQTNALLKSIACYGTVFKRLEGTDLVEYVSRTATSCPGYSAWCRHQHEIEARCRDWARSAENHYWALGTQPTRNRTLHASRGESALGSVNQQRSLDAQKRIQAAVSEMETHHNLPAQIAARESTLVAMAKCSKQTLRKYLSLWHPQHYAPLQGCTEELDPVVDVSELVLEDSSSCPKSALQAEVQAVSSMKGVLAEPEAGSEFRLNSNEHPVEQPRHLNSSLNGDVATLSTSTTSVDPSGRVDDYIIQPSVTGNTQTVKQVCNMTDSFSFTTLKPAIAQRLKQLNAHNGQTDSLSHPGLFVPSELPILKLLPVRSLQFAYWKRAKVSFDYHIEFGHHYYSVPYELVQREVQIKVTEVLIEIFHEGKRVACHERSRLKFRYTTVSNHMPPERWAYKRHSRSRFLAWAEQIGLQTVEQVKAIFALRVHEEQAFRAIRGMQALARQYGNARLEAVCHRANVFGRVGLRRLRSMLQYE